MGQIAGFRERHLEAIGWPDSMGQSMTFGSHRTVELNGLHCTTWHPSNCQIGGPRERHLARTEWLNPRVLITPLGNDPTAAQVFPYAHIDPISLSVRHLAAFRMPLGHHPGLSVRHLGHPTWNLVYSLTWKHREDPIRTLVVLLSRC